ncbi:GyrI-like domain-containing protein [Pedobacter sp. B4-66]|uniref:GyrI-like domain-containing protein n=1 Tax=Pedobacter sp. B4-66 TaxID=2817280 RepID=UPI001BD92113|nr:GyrI-like domain-containing protein [Pedobacter sp. B4-66]
MEKLDLTKKYKSYYAAKEEPELVRIEPANFLSITGKGDPSEKMYSEKLAALYATAYTLKFAYKAIGKDFVVAKLEGLWSFDEEKYGKPSISEAPLKVPRSEWFYRMMIRLPDYVTADQINNATDSVIRKKNLPFVKDTELYSMDEGLVIQMLHIGPFDQEPVTLEKIQQFIVSKGLKKNGLHHEIYLSDFNKTASEKLRTILREPVVET